MERAVYCSEEMSQWTLSIARKVHIPRDSECHTRSSEHLDSTVYYLVHKNLLQFPVPSQINSIHNFPTCFFKIHFNTGLSSAPRFSWWILSFSYSYRIFALFSKHYCDDHTKKNEFGSHENKREGKFVRGLQTVPLNKRKTEN